MKKIMILVIMTAWHTHAQTHKIVFTHDNSTIITNAVVEEYKLSFDTRTLLRPNYENIEVYKADGTNWVRVIPGIDRMKWENRAIIAMRRYGVIGPTDTYFTPAHYDYLESYLYNLSEVGQTNEVAWSTFINMTVSINALQKQIEKYGGDPKSFSYHPEAE